MARFAGRAPTILVAGAICLAACSSSPSSKSHDGSTTDAPSDSAGATSSTVVIGTAGGTVSVGGASVVVPAGALSAPTSLTVAVASDAPPLPENVTLLGNIISFTPHGQAFASPVTIKIPFTAPATGTPQLYGASGDDELWAPFTGATSANGVLSTQVTHFSWFGPMVLGPGPSTTCLQIGDPCGTPGSPGCCYRPDVGSECEVNGSHNCVTYEGGPCSKATDCWLGFQGNQGCVGGVCCAQSTYACQTNDTCCSRACSPGGYCL